MSPEWILFLITALCCITALVFQRQAYAHDRARWDNRNSAQLSDQLEKHLKDVLDMRKKIDALSLRAGLHL